MANERKPLSEPKTGTIAHIFCVFFFFIFFWWENCSAAMNKVLCFVFDWIFSAFLFLTKERNIIDSLLCGIGRIFWVKNKIVFLFDFHHTIHCSYEFIWCERATSKTSYVHVDEIRMSAKWVPHTHVNFCNHFHSFTNYFIIGGRSSLARASFIPLLLHLKYVPTPILAYAN